MCTRWLPLLALLVFLAGCASSPEVIQTGSQADWIAHRNSIAALQHWQVQGRIAVSDDNQGWSANFDWQQHGESFRIRLRGPFGQGAVELLGDEKGVRLLQADKHVVYASSAEDLLHQQTGWRLPVSSLRFWLRGLPVPDVASNFRVDLQGRLIDLQQHDWSIDYSRYQQLENYSLPDRLKLEDGSLRVKFVVDRWQLP